MVNGILERIKAGGPMNREEALHLLSIDNHSAAYYQLLEASNTISRRTFGKRGYVFAQIGLNSKPCPGNCRFCSMAWDSFCVTDQLEQSREHILDQARAIAAEGVDALFLMTTADYDFDRYLSTAADVRDAIPPSVRLVANIGDFSPEQAAAMKRAGFEGAYHIVRLREGTDTALPVKQRIDTLNAIRGAGLKLYYCVEPIGVEHSYDEMVEEMERAREYGVEYMAAMRRVNLPGGPYGGLEEVSDLEMIKIAAVTNLFVRPARSMNLHETLPGSLLAGINQLYAEYGVNPRDESPDTQGKRGLSISRAKMLLASYGYPVHPL